MIRFALSARTSTDDLQDPADSLRWQKDTAERLIQPHGEIVTIYHDIDKSRACRGIAGPKPPGSCGI